MRITNFFMLFGFVLLSQTFFCSAEAKDLSKRLGMGFKNNTSISVPSIAGIYYPSADYALLGSIGVDTEKDNSRQALGAGMRRMIFREDQMNFYMHGQLAMLSRELSGVSSSGFELGAGMGGEFFFSGLDSFGLTFEFGVAISNVQNSRFRTVGDDPVRAGMFFYF